jgi:hypothetical protein
MKLKKNNNVQDKRIFALLFLDQKISNMYVLMRKWERKTKLVPTLTTLPYPAINLRNTIVWQDTFFPIRNA